MEVTLIQTNSRGEDWVCVANFHNHERMSATGQKIKLVSEKLRESMATNLINSVFHTAHEIIEMSMVLDTYKDQPSHSAILDETSWYGLADRWDDRGVMHIYE